MADSMRVLHVDDEPEFCDLVCSFLESRNEHFEVSTTTSANTALNRLSSWGIDCIVSDYQMPEMDGLEFLRAIREEKPDLPFLLFTGRGSEEVASEAITAGVTDYIQKDGNADTYALLANRIENAVESYRSQTELARIQRRFRLLVEESTDAIFIVTKDWEISWASPSTTRVMGYSPEELIGTSPTRYIHPDDVDEVRESFRRVAESSERRNTLKFRLNHGEGGVRKVGVRRRDLTSDPTIGGIVAYLRLEDE